MLWYLGLSFFNEKKETVKSGAGTEGEGEYG